MPAIEPDLRGAKSIREILSQHRTNATCNECHQKIDPLGFALENFDPIGAWRSSYETFEVVRPGTVNRSLGAAIDASGELPDGQSFDGVSGLKAILVERKDQFARTLAERLLAYAIGRQIEPLDRPDVDQVVNDLAARGYGFRDLIELTVASAAFRSK